MNREQVVCSDCLEHMRTMPENSVDAIVTDPPYGLAFMGAKWDSFNGGSGNQTISERQAEGKRYADENKGAPRYANSHGKKVTQSEMVAFQLAMTPIFEEALRVAKPGAHLLCFGGTRTFHRMACAIEDAGWEIRDCIMWVYGCLDEETEVLVDGEFVPYNKAKKGRLALGYDIGTGNFSWQRIEDTYLYDYDDTAYAIQSDSTDQLVSRNHRCIVERGGVEQFAFAEQVAQERKACVPVLEGLQGLLDHLPLPNEGAGDEEQDVLEGVRGEGGEPRAEEAQGARAKHDMPSMRERVLRADGMEAQGENELLLGKLQEQGQVRSYVDGVQQGAPDADDRGEEAEAKRADDWTSEPVMEGRGDVSAQPRGLQGREVRQVPQGVFGDGTQGRVRDGAQACGCPSNREAADKAGMRASRQSRPVGQQAGEPDAVPVERGSQALRELWGAKATLARVTPVHYKGKMWCVKVRTGAFVARRHGKIFITGNSGFPKSMDVAKAIDKAGGVNPELASKTLRDARERSGMTRADVAEFVGCTESSVRDWEEGRARRSGLQVEYVTPSLEYREKLSSLLGFTTDERVIVGLSVDRRDDGSVIGLGHSGKVYGGPRTEAAKQWEGWGTCLKPAWEPIIVARKPLDGTVAHNVLTWGVGALNIDACRVPTGDELSTHGDSQLRDEKSAQVYGSYKPAKRGQTNGQKIGRFPANLVHDGSQMVLDLFPDTGKSSGGGMHTRGTVGAESTNVYGSYSGGIATKSVGMGDSGSAARFFYCAKASKKDRGEGNNHPTVKPTELMKWLVQLVTPEGGVVLDPFAGSGTTLVACKMLGRDCIGIEREPEYVEIIKRRLETT